MSVAQGEASLLFCCKGSRATRCVRLTMAQPKAKVPKEIVDEAKMHEDHKEDDALASSSAEAKTTKGQPRDEEALVVAMAKTKLEADPPDFSEDVAADEEARKKVLEATLSDREPWAMIENNEREISRPSTPEGGPT